MLILRGQTYCQVIKIKAPLGSQVLKYIVTNLINFTDRTFIDKIGRILANTSTVSSIAIPTWSIKLPF